MNSYVLMLGHILRGYITRGLHFEGSHFEGQHFEGLHFAASNGYVCVGCISERRIMETRHGPPAHAVFSDSPAGLKYPTFPHNEVMTCSIKYEFMNALCWFVRSTAEWLCAVRGSVRRRVAPM